MLTWEAKFAHMATNLSLVNLQSWKNINHQNEICGRSFICRVEHSWVICPESWWNITPEGLFLGRSPSIGGGCLKDLMLEQEYIIHTISYPMTWPKRKVDPSTNRPIQFAVYRRERIYIYISIIYLTKRTSSRGWSIHGWPQPSEMTYFLEW